MRLSTTLSIHAFKPVVPTLYELPNH